MNSNSQAGQDRFVASLITRPGTFLDIGCNHPVKWNNTYALELAGWVGLMVDNSPEACAACRASRKATVIEQDATQFDLLEHLSDGQKVIDYLSLDVDEATLQVLERLPLDMVGFRIITIEHDAYRFGDSLRKPQRKILGNAGYELVCADVSCDAGMPFEDWWVAPCLSLDAKRFRCSGKNFTDIIHNDPA